MKEYIAEEYISTKPPKTEYKKFLLFFRKVYKDGVYIGWYRP